MEYINNNEEYMEAEGEDEWDITTDSSISSSLLSLNNVNEENEYYHKKQAKSYEEALEFARHMCSSDFYDKLEVANITNLCGDANQTKFNVRATHMLHDYEKEELNKFLGFKVHQMLQPSEDNHHPIIVNYDLTDKEINPLQSNTEYMHDSSSIDMMYNEVTSDNNNITLDEHKEEVEEEDKEEEEDTYLLHITKKRKIDDIHVENANYEEEEVEEEELRYFREEVERKAKFLEKYNHEYQEKEKHDIEKLKYYLPVEPITEKDLEREIITIRYNKKSSKSVLRILIENYVYVTYLFNKHTRELYKFNLLDMGTRCIPYGIQGTTTKFAKNDIRYLHGGSNLIFTSSVVVETGSTNPVIASKLLEHTINILRNECGMNSIAIKDRRCQNVVATGSLNFAICLNVLKYTFPYVVYNKSHFAGAVIKIVDIKPLLSTKNGGGSSFNYNSRTEDDIDDFIYYEKDEDLMKGVIPEHLVKSNDNHQKSSSYTSSSTNHENIQSNEEGGGSKASTSSTGVVYEDDVDGDIFTQDEKEDHVAALVFPQGQVICVGSNSRDCVIRSYVKLYQILEHCRDTPENLRLERQLLSKGRGGGGGGTKK